jgi:hypothetical protein
MSLAVPWVESPYLSSKIKRKQPEPVDPGEGRGANPGGPGRGSAIRCSVLLETLALE